MNSILVSKLTDFKNIESLISNAAKHLESLGYKQRTIKNYQYVWDEFVHFVQKNSDKEIFSIGLVVQFLNSHGITDNIESNMTFRQRQ
jgi:hypothetical protein